MRCADRRTLSLRNLLVVFSGQSGRKRDNNKGKYGENDVTKIGQDVGEVDGGNKLLKGQHTAHRPAVSEDVCSVASLTNTPTAVITSTT